MPPAVEAASLALSWTLVPAVLAVGALVAAELQVAEMLALPPASFRRFPCVFIVGRLLVVAAGPGAEFLEVGGQHRMRCRVALAVALPALAFWLPFAGLGYLSAVALIVAVARAVIELTQSWLAWSRLGVDCTVVDLVRAPGPA